MNIIYTYHTINQITNIHKYKKKKNKTNYKPKSVFSQVIYNFFFFLQYNIANYTYNISFFFNFFNFSLIINNQLCIFFIHCEFI